MTEKTTPIARGEQPAGTEVSRTLPVRVDVGALTDGTRPVSWYRPKAATEAAAVEVLERRRKELERRRRDREREKEMLAAEAREGWVRIWKTVGVLVVLLGAGLAYGKLQLHWGNRWPLMDVWLWASAGVVAVIWWALRAIGKVNL